MNAASGQVAALDRSAAPTRTGATSDEPDITIKLVSPPIERRFSSLDKITPLWIYIEGQALPFTYFISILALGLVLPNLPASNTDHYLLITRTLGYVH